MFFKRHFSNCGWSTFTLRTYGINNSFLVPMVFSSKLIVLRPKLCVLMAFLMILRIFFVNNKINKKTKRRNVVLLITKHTLPLHRYTIVYTLCILTHMCLKKPF